MGWTVYINRFQNKKEFLENFISEHFSENVQIIIFYTNARIRECHIYVAI